MRLRVLPVFLAFLAMGFAADHSTVQISFLVPLAAILYVCGTALRNLRARA